MSHAILLAGLVVFAASPNAHFSQQRGTPAEAEAMLAKAVAHYESAGRAQALRDFTARKAPFADRDLYVFCISADRKVASHGGDPKQVGVVFDTLKDVDGKAFGTALWDTGIKPSGGRVEYKWQNPVTGSVEPKVTFVRKAGNDVCGVGAYAAAK
jgi:signal transduction histidine kinase